MPAAGHCLALADRPRHEAVTSRPPPASPSSQLPFHSSATALLHTHSADASPSSPPAPPRCSRPAPLQPPHPAAQRTACQGPTTAWPCAAPRPAASGTARASCRRRCPTAACRGSRSPECRPCPSRGSRGWVGGWPAEHMKAAAGVAYPPAGVLVASDSSTPAPLPAFPGNNPRTQALPDTHTHTNRHTTPPPPPTPCTQPHPRPAAPTPPSTPLPERLQRPAAAGADYLADMLCSGLPHKGQVARLDVWAQAVGAGAHDGGGLCVAQLLRSGQSARIISGVSLNCLLNAARG